MLPTHRQHLVLLLQEDQVDFSTAWGRLPVRMKDHRIPETWLNSRLLMYHEVARLAG
jgi:hypothetical protein